MVEEEQIPFLQLVAEADVKKGKKVFGKCKACHKLEPGVNGTGPYLHAIVGRTIASVAEFKYSNVFNNMEGVEIAWRSKAQINEAINYRVSE